MTKLFIASGLHSPRMSEIANMKTHQATPLATFLAYTYMHLDSSRDEDKEKDIEVESNRENIDQKKNGDGWCSIEAGEVD